MELKPKSFLQISCLCGLLDEPLIAIWDHLNKLAVIQMLCAQIKYILISDYE